jgi:AI-2E family transporter
MDGQGQSHGGSRARRARRLHLLGLGNPRPGVMGGGDGAFVHAAGGRHGDHLAPGRYLSTGDRCRVARLGATAYGTFVMGFVDNFLQPLLVGKETRMPDYLVLISTLGAIAMFGLSGFIVGPVVAALFMAVWDIFSASRQGTLGGSP